METKPDPKFYNILSIVCGTWFLLTGYLWVYFANLIISYPVAMLGIYFWRKGKQIDPNNKLNKAALIIHFVGLAVSLLFLAALLFKN